jgi:uncharacterized membrane protein YgcG
VDPGDSWRGRRADAWRQLASAPHAAAAAGGLLAVAGVAQALAQVGGSSGIDAGEAQFAFVLLTLCTVVPAWLLAGYPAAAAVVTCAACVLSLSAFHALTVAGLVAALVALYRLGRGGSQLLAGGLGLVFMCLALLFAGVRPGGGLGRGVPAGPGRGGRVHGGPGGHRGHAGGAHRSR